MEEGTSNSFNCFFSHAKFTALLCVALQHNQNQIQIKINSSCCVYVDTVEEVLSGWQLRWNVHYSCNEPSCLFALATNWPGIGGYLSASLHPASASRRFPVYLKTQHTPVSRFVSTNLPAAPPPAPPQPILPRVAEAGQSYWLCLNWGNEIKISNSHFHVEVEIFTNWNNFQLAVILKLKIFIFVPRCGSICMGASVAAAGPRLGDIKVNIAGEVSLADP